MAKEAYKATIENPFERKEERGKDPSTIVTPIEDLYDKYASRSLKHAISINESRMLQDMQIEKSAIDKTTEIFDKQQQVSTK